MDIPININFILHLPTSPEIYILFIVVLVNLALARRTWISSRKNPINIYFGLSILMAAFWTFTIIGIRIFSNPYLISLSVKLGYASGILIVFFFYLFTYYFPYKIFRLSKQHTFLLIAGTLIMLTISIFPNLLAPDYVMPEDKFKLKSLFGHTIFTIYFISIVALSFWNLFLKYKQGDGLWRLRLKQVMIATSTAFLGAVIFSLSAPIFIEDALSLEWVSPLATVFMAVYIWYNIFWKASRIPK